MGSKVVTIVVEIRDGRIVCDPAVTVHTGKWVQWVADPDDAELQFQLEFVTSRPPNTWPFVGAAPPKNTTPPGRSYLAKVKAGADEEFKYNVVVPGYPTYVAPYDPMIIVGR